MKKIWLSILLTSSLFANAFADETSSIKEERFSLLVKFKNETIKKVELTTVVNEQGVMYSNIKSFSCNTSEKSPSKMIVGEQFWIHVKDNERILEWKVDQINGIPKDCVSLSKSIVSHQGVLVASLDKGQKTIYADHDFSLELVRTE